ncbi:acyl carrier protein [Streptomyces albidochromogenes]|uniref:Acyl carrier protein n=1 Tax=Streptomyces albidochromogenes TaxID=329524 RepID=A0ABW6FES0_9ACTN
MTVDALKDQLVTLLIDKLEVKGEVTPEIPFTELELDSLVLLEFSVLLEQRYSVEIPEEDLLGAGDIAGVASLVLARQDSATTRA